MRRRLFRATLLFLLVSGVTVAPGLLSPVAHALPKDSSMTTYFSDSTHRTAVGERTVTCTGQVFQSGQVTAFFTTQLFPC